MAEEDHSEISDEGSVEADARWGKTKFNYYFTDYIDKDYPTSLSRREERQAQLEQEEALRLQKKLLSTLDNVNYNLAIDVEAEQGNVIEFIEYQNKSIVAERLAGASSDGTIQERKRVKFNGKVASNDGEILSAEESNDDIDQIDEGRKRRPINVAIKRNRGLTPYKKKEYRNPRVKHKLKYKKALAKRKHLVKEFQYESERYAGEKSGIKTSTIKSIKLG